MNRFRMMAATALCVLGAAANAQDVRAPREKKPGSSGEVRDKWDRGQKKGEFKKAAEGTVKEKARTEDTKAKAGNGQAPNKWDRGQKKGEFKRAVQGETREKPRTAETARAATPAKAGKWDRGNNTKKFNEVANPPPPPPPNNGGGGGGGGGKGGGGGSSPPPGPKR